MWFLKLVELESVNCICREAYHFINLWQMSNKKCHIVCTRHCYGCLVQINLSSHTFTIRYLSAVHAEHLHYIYILGLTGLSSDTSQSRYSAACIICAIIRSTSCSKCSRLVLVLRLFWRCFKYTLKDFLNNLQSCPKLHSHLCHKAWKQLKKEWKWKWSC